MANFRGGIKLIEIDAASTFDSDSGEPQYSFGQTKLPTEGQTLPRVQTVKGALAGGLEGRTGVTCPIAISLNGVDQADIDALDVIAEALGSVYVRYTMMDGAIHVYGPVLLNDVTKAAPTAHGTYGYAMVGGIATGIKPSDIQTTTAPA